MLRSLRKPTASGSRRRLTVFVCLAVLAVTWALSRYFVPLQNVEQTAVDFLARHGRKAAWNERLVFVAIDQASVSLDGYPPEIIETSPGLLLMSEGFPWSREVYGLIVDRLLGAGARVVAFDLMFPRTGQGDETFRRALDRFRDRAVIGFNFVGKDSDGRGARETLTLPAESIVPSASPVDDRVAFVNFWPDEDGVIRFAHYHTTAESVYGLAPSATDELYDSLAARTLAKAGRGDLVPRTRGPVRFRYASAGAQRRARVSLATLFDPVSWEHLYKNGASFRDRIVLVGPLGNWSKDEVLTPFGSMPGPLVHLNAMNAALTGEFIRPLPPLWRWVVLAASALGAAGLGLASRRIILRLSCTLAVDALFVVVVFLLYNRAGLLAPLVAPLLVFNGSMMLLLVWESVYEQIERRRTRRTLERYVSKNVVAELLDNPATLIDTLGGARREVALLFTDLRGFTQLAEQLDSTELVAQLNEYFSEMVPHIFEREGTLDKFIGDAIMAVWGNLKTRSPAADARSAVAAALAMVSSLRRLNEGWMALGRSELAMGIGIHHGEATVGSIGSEEKMEVTVIGDAVNLASRLEGTTREFGVAIVISETVAVLLDETVVLQRLGRVRVKGRQQSIGIFTVHARDAAADPAAFGQYLEDFAAGLASYEAADFAGACGHFRAALAAQPGDPCASRYLADCEELAASPPGEEWSGVFTMGTK